MANKNFLVWILFTICIQTIVVSQVLAMGEQEVKVSIRFGDKLYRVGEQVELTVTVSNTGQTDLKNAILVCNLPYQLAYEGNNTQRLAGPAAGKSESMTFKCRAIEGGRGSIYAEMTADGWSVADSSYISIKGAGWYGGDNHSHSTYSDGAGTIRQNVAVAYSKGMSWHYSADHNNYRARADLAEITSESKGDFVGIAGMEIDNAAGHALAYRLPDRLEQGTYVTKTIFNGFFDALPAGADQPVEVPYTDTNLEGSDVFFGESFGGKTLDYIAVPGMGRATDYTRLDMKGKIALVCRGEITYVEKINTAIAAGAAGVIIYNHSAGPLGMTLSAGAIGVGISQADGLKLAAPGKGTINFRKENLPSKVKTTWQMVVDEVNKSGAFFYPAHPCDGTYPFLDALLIRRFTGLEVWNNANHLWDLNVKARQLWDKINARGEAKYFGIANSDAHSPIHVACAFSMAYMDELTADNIIESLRTGTLFGSNGPQLRFDMAGLTQGKTLTITGEKQLIPVRIVAFDERYPLTEVTLYRCKIVGEATDTKEVAKSWDLKGKNVRHLSEVFNLEVEKGAFYRVEVISEKSTSSYGAAAGFAYSNPIWIETAQTKTNQAAILNIDLKQKAAKLKQNVAGNYYVVCNKPDKLKISRLTVVATPGAHVVKTYNAADRVFQVAVTSPDGSNQRDLTIYVVN